LLENTSNSSIRPLASNNFIYCFRSSTLLDIFWAFYHRSLCHYDIGLWSANIPPPPTSSSSSSRRLILCNSVQTPSHNKNTRDHPFHLVEEPPCPLLGASESLFLTSRMVKIFYFMKWTYFLLGVGILWLVIYQWRGLLGLHA